MRTLSSLTTVLLVLAVLGPAPVSAQETKRELTEGERAFLEMLESRVVIRVPGMDSVQVRKGLRYSNADPHLLADVYLPTGPRDRSGDPIVVFVHGGLGSDVPVRPKDWGPYISWGRLVAASGMVGVMFNHRLGFPAPRLDDAAADLHSLLAYVRQHAHEWHADPDRIAIVSYSAGGPLLSIAMRDSLPFVRCLAAYYSFLDIQHTEHHVKFEPEEKVRQFSPITHLARGSSLPPLFIARGGQDQIPGINDSIDRFVTEALARNVAVTLANHPEGPHGFDFKNDDPRSREIVRASLEFLRTHLAVSRAKG